MYRQNQILSLIFFYISASYVAKYHYINKADVINKLVNSITCQYIGYLGGNEGKHFWTHSVVIKCTAKIGQISSPKFIFFTKNERKLHLRT